MTDTMQGFIVRAFGGPEEMRWETLPVPEPGPGQVLVRVHASGMNFAETRMRAGTYSGQPLPFVMGMEGAGEVVTLGAGVRVAVATRGRAVGLLGVELLERAPRLPALRDGLARAVEGLVELGRDGRPLVTLEESAPETHPRILADARSPSNPCPASA